MQATIINELADLEDVDLNLVVGVPSFVMKDNLSPMAMRESAPNLSAYFGGGQNGRGNNAFSNYSISNAVMSQVVAPAGPPPPGQPLEGAGIDLPDGGGVDDLFVYHKPEFSLKKGERAIVTLMNVIVPCQDVYRWEFLFAPPQELLSTSNSRQQQALENLSEVPRVMHTIRLTNSSAFPWTTGPAMIFRGGTVPRPTDFYGTHPCATGLI